MSAYNTLIEDIILKDNQFFEKEIPSLNAVFQEAKDYYLKVTGELDKYKKTGTIALDLLSNSIDAPFLSSGRSSFKENTEPSENRNVSPAPSVRSTRNQLKKGSQLSEVSCNTLSSQSEPSSILLSSVKVKLEKISIASNILDVSDSVNIKKENEEMPAPTQLPPRRKKVKTEPIKEATRNRNKKNESNSEIVEEKRSKRTRKKPTSSADRSQERKDSDVILHNTSLETVELSDSEDNTITSESEKTNNTKTKKNKKVDDQEESGNEVRTTRTKTKNQKNRGKRNRRDTSEDVNTSPEVAREKKKSRSSTDSAKSGSELEAKKELVKTSGTVNKEVSNTSKTNASKNTVNRKVTDDESESEYKTPPMQRTQSSNINKKLVEDRGDENMKNLMNSTVVVENPKYTNNTLKTIENAVNDRPNILDTTVVISKAPVENQNGKVADSLMTDDESDEEKTPVPTKPNKKNIPVKSTNKQIFSPFDPSPVKKKVEAFERLGAESSAIPTRVTRTKTRAQAKEKDEENEPVSQETAPVEIKSTIKEKARLFTPTVSKFLPKNCSTSKISQKIPTPSNQLGHSTSNESLLSTKSASALKASQAEYREREKRRREKEAEALRKKEAMIQAQIEEKKRKREEKQIKAQQQREALEKENQKRLEAQKLKEEERYRQMLAEREEKLQKQKEEMERKRLLAKQRALEEKKKEEARKLEEQKQAEVTKTAENHNAVKSKQQSEQPQPIYMTTKAPLLPTDDCYDSDDPEYATVRARVPEWARDAQLKAMQLCMISAGEKLKNTFFCCQAQTPDLQAIFELIDPRKLKRTSSAIWRKPPRYTLMPTLDQHLEDSDEDDS